MLDIELRDGTVVTDPRLGRLIQFDARSRNFAAIRGLEERRPRAYIWRISNQLDQGQQVLYMK